MVVDLETRPEEGAVPATPPTPVRFRAARVLLVVLLVAAVAVVAAGVYDAAANRLISDHLGLVVGALVLGLLLVVALRAPRGRPEIASWTAEEQGDEETGAGWVRKHACATGERDVSGPETGPVQEEAGDAPGDTPRREVAPKDISPRALLLQVRTLEATLAEEDRRLDSLREETSRRAEEQIRVGRERVQLTLRVLRVAVAGQPGDIGAARIEAALERLGSGDGFRRPVLAAGPSAAWSVAFAPPVPFAVPGRPESDDPVAPEDAAAAAPADPAHPVVDAAAEATAEAARNDVPETPAGPPRVLPVPPLSTPQAPTRRGRGLRRNKAGV
jgi:hypothetical protein